MVEPWVVSRPGGGSYCSKECAGTGMSLQRQDPSFRESYKKRKLEMRETKNLHFVEKHDYKKKCHDLTLELKAASHRLALACEALRQAWVLDPVDMKKRSLKELADQLEQRKMEPEPIDFEDSDENS